MASGGFSITVGCFLFVIGSCLAVVEKDRREGTCSYDVGIGTLCLPYSGTDDPVKLRFGDRFGNFVERTLNNPGFMPCQTDHVMFEDTCISDVCQLWLYRSGNDMWIVNGIKVFIGGVQKGYFKLIGMVPENEWYGENKCMRDDVDLSVSVL